MPSLEAGQLLLSCEAFQYSVRTALYSDPQPHMGGEGCGHASSEKPMAHLCEVHCYIVLEVPFIGIYIMGLRFLLQFSNKQSLQLMKHNFQFAVSHLPRESQRSDSFLCILVYS